MMKGPWGDLQISWGAPPALATPSYTEIAGVVFGGNNMNAGGLHSCRQGLGSTCDCKVSVNMISGIIAEWLALMGYIQVKEFLERTSCII